MTWSLPEPPPAEPVLGDPASLSALGQALHRAAAEVGRCLDDLPPAAVGSRRHAARVRQLHTRAAPLHESMDRAGHRVTEHASDLADAIGLARRVVDRAEACGLRVDGPTVSRGDGIHGLADPGEEGAREESRARLQRVLEAILLDLDTTRERLRLDLAQEHTVVRRR